MTRRGLFWLCAAFVAVLLAVLAVPAAYILVGLYRGQAFYRGMPSCYWRLQLRKWAEENFPGLTEPRPLLERACDFCFPAGGFEDDPAAVPVLAELLRDYDWRVRYAAANALNRIGPRAEPAVPALAMAISDPEPFVREEAVSALGSTGAAAAVPALVEALRGDGTLASTSQKALWQLGPAVVVPLTDALSHPDPGIRSRVAEMLAWLGPRAATASPALIAALGDSNGQVRDTASSALQRIGRGTSLLVQALHHQEPRVRRGAAEALGQTMPNGEVIAALTAALDDEDAATRGAAARSLKKHAWLKPAKPRRP
jgi:HEAT repeat protein